MAPPSLAASASRLTQSSPSGNTNRVSNVTQSLYSSILAPPLTKHARTIHNPSDPPVPAPSRQTATPRARRGSRSSDTRSVRSIAEGTRGQVKGRKADKSPDKPKDKRLPKGKQKQRSSPKHPGEDVDMKAVAALTSLLLQSRPSISGTASSPRSDTGSNNSYSHFAQSSTRTTGATTAVNSAESSFTIPNNPNNRTTTPPPSQRGSLPHIGTPNSGNRPHAPADSEAAFDLLYLAASPSPARHSTKQEKDAKDMSAFRALSGGTGLRAAGRVLFPGTDTENDSGRRLTAAGENSFSLSISSIGSEMASGQPGVVDGSSGEKTDTTEDGSAIPGQVIFTPQQLLPPPPSPSANANNSDSAYQSLVTNPWPSDNKLNPLAPPTPNSASFNINDFINVSPSSAAASPSRNAGESGELKPGFSIAGVRRKLFEDAHSEHESPPEASGESGMPISIEESQRGFDEFNERQGTVGPLSAGIDLIQT
jgi:hypothetical protein